MSEYRLRPATQADLANSTKNRKPIRKDHWADVIDGLDKHSALVVEMNQGDFHSLQKHLVATYGKEGFWYRYVDMGMLIVKVEPNA